MEKRVKRIDIEGDLDRGFVFESTIKDPIEFTVGGKIYLIRPGLVRVTGRYMLELDKVISAIEESKDRGDKEMVIVISSGNMTEEVYIPRKLYDNVLMQLYKIKGGSGTK